MVDNFCIMFHLVHKVVPIWMCFISIRSDSNKSIILSIERLFSSSHRQKCQIGLDSRLVIFRGRNIQKLQTVFVVSAVKDVWRNFLAVELLVVNLASFDGSFVGFGLN